MKRYVLEAINAFIRSPQPDQYAILDRLADGEGRLLNELMRLCEKFEALLAGVTAIAYGPLAVRSMTLVHFMDHVERTAFLSPEEIRLFRQCLKVRAVAMDYESMLRPSHRSLVTARDTMRNLCDVVAERAEALSEEQRAAMRSGKVVFLRRPAPPED